jgi:hypothetical protein
MTFVGIHKHLLHYLSQMYVKKWFADSGVIYAASLHPWSSARRTREPANSQADLPEAFPHPVGGK